MADTQPRQHRQPGAPSRLGMRHPNGGGGEIVEVQGGHIVRSTGRKDRHSKVCTAKGPRDRRVRLSAHTAIQFYDVQDRLGYDRPSKAVDWLITKARAAIDELAELPPWHPTAMAHEDREQELGQEIGDNQFGDNSNSNSNNNNNNNNNNNSNSSFLPPSMDSDSIADTIKSFFPMGAVTAEHNSSAANFPAQFHSQDLRLSLQSFDNPIFSLHHHHAPPSSAAADNTLLGFDHGGSAGWADFQRMVGWNAGSGGDTTDTSAAVMYNAPVAVPLLFGGNQFVSQRGPLQSSNHTQSIRAWIDPPPPMAYAGGDHHQSFPGSYHHQQQVAAFQGFSGFRVPARIRGDEEEHDGISDKPSSASSDSLSRH